MLRVCVLLRIYSIFPDPPVVLDPRYKDALFTGPMSHYFDKNWLTQCASEMEMILTLEYSDTPPPLVSSKTPPSALSVANPKHRFNGGFSFANRAVLGAPKKGAPATETPAAQVKKYLGEGIIDSEGDPLQWWKDNAYRFPALARMARVFLAIPGEILDQALYFLGRLSIPLPPGSSVSVERALNIGRDVISLRRSSLSANTIRSLMTARSAILLEKKIV